jgi:hypothetical protein
MISWLDIFDVVIILIVIFYFSRDVVDLDIVRIQRQIQKKSTSILSIVYQFFDCDIHENKRVDVNLSDLRYFVYSFASLQLVFDQSFWI